MEDFIGRSRELALLKAAWEGPGSAFIPVYGRRRVGKSELILRFLKDRPGLYFVGKQAPAALQLTELLRVAADAVGEPLLASLAPMGWKDALEAIVGRWRGPGKLVLALDEFQWMASASPELPSVLQELWDRRWRDRGDVLLILCGSYVGFMEREVLGRKSPLFGRRTAQIHLQPFGFREARAFHPQYALADSAATWFVCGGIPLYLRQFSPHRSVEMNLRRTLFDELAPLYREADFLLREELREVQNYYAVLTTLATGATAATEIARATRIPERSLSYYVDQLVELGYVRRRHPLTGGRPVARHVRFELDDPLLRFWFRFVWPHTSFLAATGPERTFETLVRPHLPAYFGHCFEALCRAALPAIYADEGVTAGFEVGEYWDRQVQVDVVGLREDHWTDLGECKWGAVRSPEALARELDAKVAPYPNPRNATIGRRVFARRTINAKVAKKLGVRWHGLEDLYGV